MVAAGIRGIIASPVSLTRALESSPEYDQQLTWLFSTGCTVEEAYRELRATDALAACAILRPTYERSQCVDGLVSIEITPSLARSTLGVCATANRLHQRIDRPNLLVAVPATPLGVPAVQAMVSAGHSINATSIFSLARYSAVIDAYQSGLETFVGHGGDPADVHGLATFSPRPVDAEVDRRLERQGGAAALELRGLAAVAQAKLAYRLFEERFSNERWARLARLGARPQRLVWGLAGTHLDDRYLDELAMPNTVYSLPESAIVAAQNRTDVGRRPHTIDIRGAAAVLSDLAARGIDLNDIGLVLENQSAALAQDSLTEVYAELSKRWGRR